MIEILSSNTGPMVGDLRSDSIACLL
jgi:hypothetical protein